jgi:predicted DNA-binding protein (MmcQ/YjbR family)
MTQASLRRLRDICLALPEAEERETWGEATFRVRDKIFCMHHDGYGDGPVLTCKAPPGSQTILVGADPKRFYVPPYVGHKGWVGMKLGKGVDWREVAELVKRSYRMTAPKKLQASILEKLVEHPQAPSRKAGATKGRTRRKVARRGTKSVAKR